MTTGPIVLGSLELSGALEALDLRRVVFVPTAANGLEDREAIVEVYRSPFVELGIQVLDVDLDELDGPRWLPRDGFDAVVGSGGNPYRLLDAARRSGFDRWLHERLSAGVTYVGASAGAIVAGPSVEPIHGVTPFDRPAGFDTTGLGLTGTLVLPHDDRPGRRALHAAAQRTHGRTHHLLPITDAETVRIDAGEWRLQDHHAQRTIRPAREADAGPIAGCYLAAGRAAWDFVDERAFAELEPPEAAWRERLAGRTHPDEVLVAEDAEGLIGFIWVRPATDADLARDGGEVGAFYTHPRVWGAGAGRRLLELGLDRLRAMGCSAAVLYTEERNERPRRVYEQLGWTLDGTARERAFLGAPIRELRHRLVL